MSTKAGRIGIFAGLAAAALALAGAAGATTISLAGTQTVVNEAKGAYQMHGTLVGEWQVSSFIPEVRSGTELVGRGKEYFTGCVDSNKNGSCDPAEPAGKISFTYLFWSWFNPKTKTELYGQCLHPVVGGTGQFANATGIVHMTDTIVAHSLRTTYNGKLTFGATAAERVPTSAFARATAC
jgi:hypothetical protein